MPSFALIAVVLPLLTIAVLSTAFLVYVWFRYSPIVRRIFESTPMFAPLRVTPDSEGEDVRFSTADGLELAGTYLPTSQPSRAGVIVFCPEFLGDRWSVLPYADGIREAGFDLFSFDFRNHGNSETDPSYAPLQWVSDLELCDLRAALAYLRSRPDADPAGVGLFGVSRGAGTALCVAAEDPRVWGVVTDGAFPTRGTMMAYILRWAEIYVGIGYLWRNMPRFVFAFAGWAGRMSSQRRSGRQYPNIERAVSRLAPRPWLMIHGERDAYIGPEIALSLLAHAGDPKECWIVPRAKHNRCREADPSRYRHRVLSFFVQYAPRRAVVTSSPSVGLSHSEPSTVAAGARSAVPAPVGT